MENIAIGTNEGWDLSKLVDLAVVGGDTYCRVGDDKLEVDVVCLRNCTDGSSTNVAL